MRIVKLDYLSLKQPIAKHPIPEKTSFCRNIRLVCRKCALKTKCIFIIASEIVAAQYATDFTNIKLRLK